MLRFLNLTTGPINPKFKSKQKTTFTHKLNSETLWQRGRFAARIMQRQAKFMSFIEGPRSRYLN